MYYNINFEEFHKKETENRWKAMENGWNGDLWQKLCNESAEKHLKLLDQCRTGIPDFSGPFITEKILKDLYLAYNKVTTNEKCKKNAYQTEPKKTKKVKYKNNEQGVNVQKKLNLNNVCRVFCFNEAIFKSKLEKVLCNLELELNTDIYYDKSTTKIDPYDVKFNSIHQSNLKVFNYDKNDKGKIISFFKNHGFKYTRQDLHDRLIFKYVSCLYE
jgi:hypothetical protein